MTAAVFFVMATIATVSKRDFSFLGKFLFVGADRADRRVDRQPVLPGAGADQSTISAIAVLIFSMYLLHDLSQIVRGGQTNYIMATIACSSTSSTSSSTS